MEAKIRVRHLKHRRIFYGDYTVREAAEVFDPGLANLCTDAKKNCVIANAAFAIHTLNLELLIASAEGGSSESLESGARLSTVSVNLWNSTA